MKKAFIAALVIPSLMAAGAAFGGEWKLTQNVKRLERVCPDYKEDRDVDKKFIEVLDLTEKTRKEDEVYQEAKRIAAMPALAQSKYMDSFLYYLYVRSLSLPNARAAESAHWLGLLKAQDASPHLLAAQLIHLRLLPKKSPDLLRETQLTVEWIKAQKTDKKVRPPEYTGNILLGYKPRSNFAEGDPLKLYTLSYYKETVTPPAGFLEDDLYISLLSRIREGREDILDEMAGIYRRMGKRKEASDILYQHAVLKANGKDYQKAKALLDNAVKLNAKNEEARKLRDRIKLELTYQSLAPSAPVEAPAPAKQEDTASIPEHLTKVEGYLVDPGRVISDAELKGRSKAELRVMRNEIYARHGKAFESPDLKAYFTAKSWYAPNPDYDDAMLTDTDKQNVKILQEREDGAQ